MVVLGSALPVPDAGALFVRMLCCLVAGMVLRCAAPALRRSWAAVLDLAGHPIGRVGRRLEPGRLPTGVTSNVQYSTTR
jgi:hypothetical protein